MSQKEAISAFVLSLFNDFWLLHKDLAALPGRHKRQLGQAGTHTTRSMGGRLLELLVVVFYSVYNEPSVFFSVTWFPVISSGSDLL